MWRLRMATAAGSAETLSAAFGLSPGCRSMVVIRQLDRQRQKSRTIGQWFDLRAQAASPLPTTRTNHLSDDRPGIYRRPPRSQLSLLSCVNAFAVVPDQAIAGNAMADHREGDTPTLGGCGRRQSTPAAGLPASRRRATEGCATSQRSVFATWTPSARRAARHRYCEREGRSTRAAKCGPFSSLARNCARRVSPTGRLSPLNVGRWLNQATGR